MQDTTKTVYDLHRFWTSMSANFGFTFHIGRMTEVLTPDIYRAHCSSTSHFVLHLKFRGHFNKLPAALGPGLYSVQYNIF